MGKFTGLLFYSDYDATLYNEHHQVSQESRDAIAYFVREGGRFSIATGRGYTAFTPQIEIEHLTINAPVILANGASIFDYTTHQYLISSTLHPDTKARMQALCRDIPELALEAYRGEEIYVHNPNIVTESHLSLVGSPHTLCAIPDMPLPWNKVLLEQDTPVLQRAQDYILQAWSQDYEAIFSNPYLLEVTAKGCNKGTMAAWAANYLGIQPEHLYCIGDNQNDIPMLALSAIPFAPPSCASEVKEWGARILTSDDHCVAEAIQILDGIFP